MSSRKTEVFNQIIAKAQEYEKKYSKRPDIIITTQLFDWLCANWTQTPEIFASIRWEIGRLMLCGYTLVKVAVPGMQYWISESNKVE